MKIFEAVEIKCTMLTNARRDELGKKIHDALVKSKWQADYANNQIVLHVNTRDVVQIWFNNTVEKECIKMIHDIIMDYTD